MTRALPSPRYPIFVPSKGRAHRALTHRFLAADDVPHRIVVEPSEVDVYRDALPDADLLVLPFGDRGSVVPARNWIRDVAEAEGHARHWQLDDNIRHIARHYRGTRIRCDSGVALRVCEDFADRYTNVGVAGLNYRGFALDGESFPPFWLNCHVYSCSLISHAMPYRWRGTYNEDTDLCLQVLAGGLCTVALNVFVANKEETMVMRGGNTDALYRGDGRLRMARELERRWPYVVDVRRRWDRPQHHIRGQWRGFDTALVRRDDVDFDALPSVDEYGLRLVRKRDQIDDVRLLRLLDQHESHTAVEPVDR